MPKLEKTCKRTRLLPYLQCNTQFQWSTVILVRQAAKFSTLFLNVTDNRQQKTQFIVHKRLTYGGEGGSMTTNGKINPFGKTTKFSLVITFFHCINVPPRAPFYPGETLYIYIPLHNP